VLAVELGLAAHGAAQRADALRRACLRRGESFLFETAFSDRARDEVAFLQEAQAAPYTAGTCFIGVSAPAD
jgi:predicted ABC-type ATPase